MEEEDRGPFIQTHSGLKFFPCDPSPDSIYIGDIANALASIRRYGGHGRITHHYSVAEHSFLMADYAADLGNMRAAIVALFHDAAEAYVNDLPRAVKEAIGPGYEAVENQIGMMIYRRYGLMEYFEENFAFVKELDSRIIENERKVVLPYPVSGWGTENLAPLEGVKISCVGPSTAKMVFLITCRELFSILGLNHHLVEVNSALDVYQTELKEGAKQ